MKGQRAAAHLNAEQVTGSSQAAKAAGNAYAEFALCEQQRPERGCVFGLQDLEPLAVRNPRPMVDTGTRWRLRYRLQLAAWRLGKLPGCRSGSWDAVARRCISWFQPFLIRRQFATLRHSL